jgi:hypothetical protein
MRALSTGRISFDLHYESLVWLLPYQEVQETGIRFAEQAVESEICCDRSWFVAQCCRARAPRDHGVNYTETLNPILPHALFDSDLTILKRESGMYFYA